MMNRQNSTKQCEKVIELLVELLTYNFSPFSFTIKYVALTEVLVVIPLENMNIDSYRQLKINRAAMILYVKQ